MTWFTFMWVSSVAFGTAYFLLALSATKNGYATADRCWIQSSIWIATSFILNAIDAASPLV